MLERLPVSQYREWTKENILNHAQEFLKIKTKATHLIIQRVLSECVENSSEVIDSEKFKRFIQPQKNELLELQNRIQATLPTLDTSLEEYKTIVNIAKVSQDRLYCLDLAEKTVETLGEKNKIVYGAIITSFIGLSATILYPLNGRLKPIEASAVLIGIISFGIAMVLECGRYEQIQNYKKRLISLDESLEKPL